MSDHIISRAEGKVAIPEAGDGVFIQFDVQAFEQLETAFQDKEDHIAFIMKSMIQMKTSVFAKVLSAALHGPSSTPMPFGLQWEDLTDRIMNALTLAIHGRTSEEQKAVEQEQMFKQAEARMKGLDANPQLAAFLSLMAAGQPESEQDSDQTRSVA